MYQNCVEGCSLATNSPLVVMADICQWQKFIMYKNETQKINMEDTLLIIKQINVLNNYRYFLRRLFTPRRYENYKVKGKYEERWGNRQACSLHALLCALYACYKSRLNYECIFTNTLKIHKNSRKVLAEMLRNHTVTPATYHRWPQQGF